MVRSTMRSRIAMACLLSRGRRQPPTANVYKGWRASTSLISKKEMATVVSAVEMGARQREISVSEFFTKNRHLLGFDNPRKALLTCVKEAVDNALDAAEEAGILPDVVVTLEVASNGGAAPAPRQANRFRVTVIDYGPGIV